jgi:hypothetical protein
MKKTKLLPLPVPWSVSPSTSYLRLFANESESDTPSQIRFVAQFCSDVIKKEYENQTKKIESPQIFYSPYDTNIKLGPKGGTVQLIKVTLIQTIEARIAAAVSDSAAINYSDFDCSAMQFQPNEPISNAGAWLKAFHQKWIEAGICPDPHAYEAQESKLVSQNALSRGFKHFIFVGHDAYIEVVAKAWTWESEGTLRQSHNSK